MTLAEKYRLYEKLKKQHQNQGLSTDEYERRLKAIAFALEL